MAAPGPLSSAYINGVYIPCGLLIVGCAITKADWLPYAVLVAAVLGGWKVYSSRGFSQDIASFRTRLIKFRTAQDPHTGSVPAVRAEGEDDSVA
jgi:hypothetical protein